MKLSDAIRLGSMVAPQSHGFLVRYDKEDGSVIEACALGAALISTVPNHRGVTGNEAYDAISSAWPWVASKSFARGLKAVCDMEGKHAPEDVIEIIWTLNDRHQWTREQIADWVAAIEPQDTSAEQTAEELAVRA